MGILHFAPSMDAPSHLWMRRMAEGLSQHTSVLVTCGRSDTSCAGDAEVIWLANKRTYSFRPAQFFHDVQRQHRNANLVWRAMQRPDVSCALVHYLDWAVRLSRAWRQVDKSVFVHCHGHDIAWGKRPVQPMGVRAWGFRDYVHQVQSLPTHVHFIANSESTRDKLLKIGIGDDRIVVKYLGVPVPGEFPSAQPRREGIRILYLGRLIDFKGPDLTIQAFERASKRGMNADLIIAGDGPLRQRCEQLRESSPVADRITLLGAVSAEEGESLRRKADVFTAHSQHGSTSGQEEAFGVAFVEAMAAGLPVVTGRSGGIKEVVRDGVDGILFAPGDVEAHAEALFRMAECTQTRTTMGHAAWCRALEHFSVGREISQLLGMMRLLNS